MPSVNGSFQGQQLILPGAYYADNVSATLPANPAATPPLLVIGIGYGGAPLTPINHFTSTGLATTVRGGPVAAFLPFIFTPSPELNGAQQVTYINPAPNTQSAYSLLNSSGVSVINLTSADYGTPSNLLQVEVSDGPVGGIDLTIFDSYGHVSNTGNNLGLPFQLAYTGTASGVTYSVLTSGGVATNFIINSSVANESLNLPLSGETYGTVSAVVMAINGTGYYSAQVVSDGALPSTMLDAASGVALPIPVVVAGVSTDQFVDVTATLGDVAYWVNTYASALATASIVSGTVSSPSEQPAVIPLTNFTGATNVVPSLQDYANAFNVALTVPAWAVITDSNDLGVMALGQQHVATASSITSRKFRRFFTGSSVAETVTQALQYAKYMDAINVTYVYPGIQAINTNTGLIQTYGGRFVAAAAAAMAAGNRVAIPLTYKALNGTGVEVQLTLSEINQLVNGGVMPIHISDNTGVPTIVRDMTTWQIDNNPENVFNQQVSCRYFLAYSMNQVLQPYTGSIASPTGMARIQNAAKKLLNALLYTAGSNGILVAWDPKTLRITYSGATSTASVTVNVIFVGQVDFITTYVTILPLSLTA
jgi:hypothetical protein